MRTRRRFHLELIGALALTFALSGLGADLFVVLLKGSKIFTGFGEFTFFHTFADIPVDESTLGVHKIELVVDTGKSFSDSGRVGNHTASTHNLGKITTWNDSWWLVVNTALETSWAPVDELDGSLGLDGGDSGVDILWDDITTVHQTASHVLTMTRIALGEHRGWFENRVGDFGNRQLFVVCFLGRDDWSVGGKHKVDSWVWHQVSLELSDIDVKSTIETKRSSQRRSDLSDDSVQVGVCWSFNVQASSAQVIDGFVVKTEVDITMFQKSVSRKDVIVWFNNSGGNLWSWRDGESQLGLFTVVNRKTLQKKSTKTGSGTTTSGVVEEETLETSAVVSQLTDAVQDEVDNFLTNGVVTTGVVIGGIFFSGDQLFWVVQLTVGSGSDFIDDSWFKVNEDTSWDVLSGTSLREEGVESIITTTDGLVAWHLSVRLNTVL
jgi:hypothetical protein